MAEASAVVLIIVGAFAPEAVRLHLFDAALGCAVVSFFSPSGAVNLRRKGAGPGATAGPRVPAAPVIGTPVLWLMAATLALVAVIAAVVAFAPGAAPGAVAVILGSGAACGAVVRIILRRSRPRAARPDRSAGTRRGRS